MYREFAPLLQPVARELEQVLKRLEQTLSPQARSLLRRELSDAKDEELLVPPVLVLLSASLFNQTERGVLPALFALLVQLGSFLHHLPAHKTGREKQLLILTGDYIYGHLYHLLCENDCFMLLERFARLISLMNEGEAILEGLKQVRRANPPGVMDGLKRRYGVFFGESCALGCLFAGGTSDAQDNLYRFGVAAGTAYGASKYLGEPRHFYPLPSFLRHTALERYTRELITASSMTQLS